MERDWEGSGPKEVIATYRYLRMAMPILALMLGAAVMIQVFAPSPNCRLGSISAYYYTSARAVFVATLCAIGTCLFVYRGSTDREDTALNISGALAFFVALIPTPLSGVVDGPEPVCRRSNVPTPGQFDAALDNNVWAALAAGAAVALIYVVLRMTLPETEGRGRPKPAAVIGTCAAVAVAALVFRLWPETVVDHGHAFAAILLFVGVAATVAMNAFPRLAGAAGNTTPQPFRDIYIAVVALMVTVMAGIGIPAAAGVWETGLFWLEASLITLFAAFWVAQTFEHWTPGAASADLDVAEPEQPVTSGVR